MASIAVYPATEELQNVKSTTRDSIDKETAYSFEALGEYLPTVLPEGYQFEKASLSETTMTNGTKYDQIRVTYADGSTVEGPATTDPETGEKVQNAPTTTGNTFAVFVMNYQPNAENPIYSGDALTQYVKELPSNGVFYFSYDMVIGTSAIVDTEIDGAVGMNSGIFNNPFIIWGKYRKHLLRYSLPLSFQFHHTQIDGAHAGRFLENLQREINRLK